MSDRYNYLTVLLEQDIKNEDAQSLIEAIQMLRGVLAVKPNVSNASDWLAESRAKQELQNKLWEVLK